MTAPPARGYHLMASLGANLGVVVLGGETAGPRLGGHVLLDLWAYRGSEGWRELARGKPHTSDGPATFDAESNRLIVLGARDVHYKLVAENWIYDPTRDSWLKKGPGNRPSLGNADYYMVYDSESDRGIMFTANGETWAYDLDRDTWTQKSPKSPPAARNWSAMTYDRGQDRVVLFGGTSPGTEVENAETWSYDYNTDRWRNMEPAKSPPARHYTAMTYDPTSRRSILFGGATGPQEALLCDTWSYDLATNTWTQLSASTSPSARGWHAMAFDASTGKIVLFGGGADRGHFQNDTWLFDPGTTTWSRG